MRRVRPACKWEIQLRNSCRRADGLPREHVESRCRMYKIKTASDGWGFRVPCAVRRTHRADVALPGVCRSPTMTNQLLIYIV